MNNTVRKAIKESRYKPRNRRRKFELMLDDHQLASLKQMMQDLGGKKMKAQVGASGKAQMWDIFLQLDAWVESKGYVTDE